MRYQRMVAGLGLVAVVFFSACVEDTERSARAGAQNEVDIAAIRGLFERFDSAATSGLAEEWMSLLSDDIIWMVPNQTELVGKDAVWRRVGSFFSELNMEHSSVADEVRVADDWAYVRGTYAFRVTPKAGGEATEEVGKFVYVLGRQADNSWRITRAIWNANRPAPAQ